MFAKNDPKRSLFRSQHSSTPKMSPSTIGKATPGQEQPDAPSDELKAPVFKTWIKQCALLLDEVNDVVFGSKSLSVEMEVNTIVTTYMPLNSDP
ncbi:hypothetical protein QQX98_004476 [Neonectria punicea]|uniref:Uncharacterized protein n=1 Tax=Neonectria punicea TaxID=979145 RepID=A0ABR1H943_9HYPO